MARIKITEPAANPPVTMSAEALKALLVAARADALAERGAANKEDSAAKMEKLAIRAFTKAGFEDVQPRINCLTFNRWVEKGMRPKEGERAIRCKSLRLFHETQCRPLTKEDRAALAEKTAKGTASKLPAVSPVTRAA